MIKLEHVVLASSEQMEFIIEGMRNPMNSWNKTDSFNGCETYKGISKCLDCDGVRECGAVNKYLIVGEMITPSCNVWLKPVLIIENS